jgi:hypothetical protein
LVWAGRERFRREHEDRTQLDALKVVHEQALAVLVGKLASDFVLNEIPLEAGTLPPVIPAGLRSNLLER